MQEAIDGLSIRADGRYVDCTFGRGGHSRAILDRLGEDGQVFALDKDWDAVDSDEAGELRRDGRFRIAHGGFRDLGRRLDELAWRGQVAGVLLDLGVSSPQLDRPERGFSFMRDGPLDMRMDRSRGMTAAEWLRAVSEPDLARVLKEFGEERYARRIARAIMDYRRRGRIETTLQLAELIAKTIPRREPGQHPATRSFQAIRIAVNEELQELALGLAQAVDNLMVGGRLVVIAFHSLEDRIIKRFMRDEERGRPTLPGPLPADRLPPRLRRIGNPQRPGDVEVRQNPRARSAILRVAERLPS